ncbi:MAG: response regulator [Gammaproteobacteria bacterium]|nr:response regulator [Rhodocyclaceae bacterium]MBU3908191.1 response regulator [Gammaproteobacteria bacterium]MBU3988381.1 response regulator [Gammaproteobacteria bacterium]MBU4005984.1 response regulator [Gammaproteobacteria bacterium]MBU4020010.1 response regulator [Gammaproteobacteria bacterium]
MTKPLLVIDDDAIFNGVLVRAFARRGIAARGATSPNEARKIIREGAPERVVLDLNLAGTSGLALIPELLTAHQDCRIVVLTGYASIATAVDAIKLGAMHYLAKPVEVDAILAAFAEDTPETEAVIATEPMSVNRLEWEHIQRVLQTHEGNISATARSLHMHRRTLQRKLAKRPSRS